MAQTSYSRGPATVGFAGMIGAPNALVFSFINDQGANIPAGVFLSHKAEGTADLVAGASERLAGVAVNSFARNPNDLTSTAAITAGDSMDVLTEGFIWVRCEEAMAVNDPVYIRHTANGGNTQLGAVRNDADTTTARLCKGARVMTPSTGAGIVLLFVSVAADTAAL